MSSHAISDADFKLFIVLWNQKMGQSTPAIHTVMSNWLELNWCQKNSASTADGVSLQR